MISRQPSLSTVLLKRFAVGCASLLLFMAACGKRETNVDRGNREQILHRGVGPEIADLDPHLAVGISEYNILSALLEGLVSEDPVDLHPVPGAAERWEISPDSLTYTFYLRADAKWSNGDPVTAQDFASSFRRILTRSLAASNASLLFVIENAEGFYQGRITDFAQVGITAVDARTLRIRLEHPTPYFLSMLNHTAFFPVHLPTIEKNGPVAERGNNWARPGVFVGNGPFVLSEWKSGQKIVAKKSSTYWDAAKVRLQEIHFHSIDSRDAEERAFRSGQLHLTETLPPAKIDTYRQEQPSLLRIDKYTGTEFYRLNTTRPFLNDKRVRRALALAVNRTAIVEKILRGGQLPAKAFTPPETNGYTSAASVPTDPEAARALLAEAGYPKGQGAPTLDLLFNTSESHRAVAEAIQEMWRRELGLNIQLLNQENKTIQAARRTGDYQMLRSAWISDYANPESFLGIWTTNSGNNYTGWNNASYDQLLYRAARTDDLATRNSLLQEAEAILLDEMPFVPIYHYTHIFLIQPSVKNWHPTLLDHHPYKHVYLQMP